MSNLSEVVRTNVSKNCLTTKCQRKRCKVNLPKGDSPFIVIDMDHPESPVSNDETRCDYLFVGECNDKDWVVPIELKGKPRAKRIVAQLQSGARFADKIVPKRAMVKFKPVAAYDGQFRRAEVDAFRDSKNKVTFRQQSELVLLRERVISLEKIL